MRTNIEAERARAGLTKTDLASTIDVSLTTYGSYLNGGNIPSDKLCALADLFGVTTDYLLGRTAPTD